MTELVLLPDTQPTGELVEPRAASLFQLADWLAALAELLSAASQAKAAIADELRARYDEGNLAGTLEGYTQHFASATISFPRPGAGEVDANGLRLATLASADALGLAPERVEALFTVAKYARRAKAWTDLESQLPALADLRERHTIPKPRYAKIERSPLPAGLRRRDVIDATAEEDGDE